MKRMRKCAACGKYTLEQSHCGAGTISPHPPKFSIEDKYAAYRRAARNFGRNFSAVEYANSTKTKENR